MSANGSFINICPKIRISPPLPTCSINICPTVISLHRVYDEAHGDVGMTLLGSNNDDSSVILPDIGFDFYYNNINCRNTLKVSGNSWVSFGSSTEHLKVNRYDAKYQNAYYSYETIGGIQAFRFRYQGSEVYSPVSNDLWWELILFADGVMELIIERFPINLHDSSLNMGTGIYTKEGGWVAGESYVFTPTEPMGLTYTVTLGYYPHTVVEPPVSTTMNFHFNIADVVKAYSSGWVNIDNSLKTIDSMWVVIDGLLYKITTTGGVTTLVLCGVYNVGTFKVGEVK